MMLRDKLHTKNNLNTRFFLSNITKRRFIIMFWRYILTFSAKKTFKNIIKINGIISLIVVFVPMAYTYKWAVRGEDKNEILWVYYFNFAIVNFLFICSNNPATPAYGVYISQYIVCHSTIVRLDCRTVTQKNSNGTCFFYMLPKQQRGVKSDK